LVVQAQHSFADAPPLDVLVYPGGQGTRPQLHDDGQLGWIPRQRGPLMTSVCTGSLAYAAAGLLSHRPASTHWASLDLLAELDPTIDVRRDERFVETATRSPPQGCRPESIWRCTSLSGSSAQTVLVRCDESSNTARRRRCKPQRIVLSRDNN
jgi:putative intracellular protease/amidase